MRTLTNKQARRFILRKNGLLGGHRFRGKNGVVQYVRQAGCIQFDPIDVCGRNADLVLQARVGGYKKEMLDALLYRDRKLVDYFDKQLAICLVEDWPHFERMRAEFRERSRSHDQVEAVIQRVMEEIKARGSLSSKDLDMDEKTDWYWSDTRLSRAALETLYFRGDLVVHHKEGTNKTYARACDCLPETLLTMPDPCSEDAEHKKWQIRRRVGAVGLLWNRPSDAFLGIEMKSEQRNAAFAALEAERSIVPVRVEGISAVLYYLAEDEALMDEILSGKAYATRTEFLAPLDGMMWDRKLIQALFGYHYRWEIYTPAAQRKYGYYTLPILRGDRLIGRIEPVCVRKQNLLQVKNIWLEEDTADSPALRRDLDAAVNRLCAFNGMTEGVKYDPE